ncbi:RICIN domain-containing protein [Lentzea sp. CC55]|uniref:RICIN domain-containing protein n=1 Tax=Lentzea sp. CC55 TaxID=2884909 RepID=UPI001F318652|nr:RICIN domain-containing protein [Lentzea sp. CC55]MCG8927677.1 RICIN domain-containing protein [Lentzea sp. CC55]
MQNWHSFVVSDLSEPTGTKFVLDLAGADGQPLTPLVLNPRTSTPAPQGPRPNQLWCVNGNLLVNRLNGLCANVTASLTTPGTQVIAWRANGENNEVFTLTDGAFMSSLGNGTLALTVQGGSTAAGTPVVVDTYTGSPAQTWALWPTYPVQGILGLPAGQFPAYTGGQGNAYDSINEQLQQADLLPRTMTVEQSYSDLTISPLTLSLFIGSSATCPTGVSATDWNAVVTSLQQQLSLADDIQRLFGELTGFINSFFIDSEALLDELGADVGLGSQSHTGATVLALVEGTVYTALSALGPVASVVANLMSTAYNVYETTTKNPLATFEGAFADLWGALSEAYTGILAAAGSTENSVLQSWAQMQAFQSGIADGELNWSAELTGQLVEAATPGYSLAIMQALIPSRYGNQLWAQYPQSQGPVNGPQGAQYSVALPGGAYDVNLLASGASSGDCPSEAALADIWNNGALPQDVFGNQNGWSLYTHYQDCDANTLYTTIWNQTPDDLSVTACTWNQTSFVAGAATRPLAAWSSITYGTTNETMNTDVGFNVFNPAVSTSTPVATFHGHMDVAVLEAGNVSVTAQSTTDDYQLVNTQCANGSFHHAQPGLIQITVTTTMVTNGTSPAVQLVNHLGDRRVPVGPPTS